MKNKATPKSAGKGKTLSVFALYLLSVLIIFAGAALSIGSFAAGTTVGVLSSRIPGAAFGLTILFLGIRYFLSVRKLKARVYRPEAVFSWNNFRRENHK